ncbi:17860_t:CDS:2, partial [Dentiscutata erythropus]
RTSGERNLDELLKEILRLNHDRPNICDLVNEGILRAQVIKVTKAFENDSKVFPQGNKINHWKKENIRNWADAIKETEITRDPGFLEEMIAVLKRTNILYCGNDPRMTQILAILLFESTKGQGKLLQVSTGEGKSTICAMLASIKALQGEYVDIMTSSPILAKRDADERKSFYEILGIDCASNEGEDLKTDYVINRLPSGEIEVKKKCYLNKIVYGDLGRFQFDWLEHEHKKNSTRWNRGFGVVIVDEVDNMMIDDSNRTARLTGSLAGFEYLNPVFCGVANELNRISKQITEIKGKTVYLDGEFKEEKDKLYLGENTKIHEIDNLYEFLSKSLTEFITKIIKEKVIELPDFLRDFWLNSVEEVVESAIQSCGVYERIDYLAVKDKDKNSKIAPVDYNSTGIVQEGMTYSNGLQQILQIKHGLKLTPQTVVTSFISNLRYFKKYGTKIYGMTGTIGSKEEQDLLSSIYEINFGFIPTYKVKQFKEIDGIVASDKQEWYINIVYNMKQEIERGRAVLVICKTIDDVTTLYDILKNFNQGWNIRKYSRNDNDNDECSAVKEKVDSGDIIIATNLAGRGTDIKTSTMVEKNGGLHVIVTFLPLNSRVEEQAFGRTARQGAKGTAQLIINKIYTENQFNVSNILNNIFEFKQFRDCREYIKILESKLYKTKEVELRDILFEIYLDADKYLREIEKKKIDEKSIDEKEEGDIYKYKLLQIEERWGIELKMFEKTLAYDIETQEKLKKVAGNLGFKLDEKYNTDKKIFSLYNAINISLENKASSEHLLWFTVGHFLDTFAERYNKQYQYNNIFDSNFYEKVAKSFNDQEALKSLVSILRRNIVIISSNQESAEIYKIKDSKETIYLGLEAGSKKYYRNYRPLLKDSNNNKTIKNYQMRVTDIKATKYKSNINLFERKEIRKLLDKIIEQESEEIKKCNLIIKQESISYFRMFFNKIKEEYNAGYKIMKNPAYMVQIGIKKSKLKEKIDILEGACNLEEKFSLPANYNLAHAIIEEQEEGYKQRAVSKLSVAKNRIDKILIPQLEYMQLTLLFGQGCELSKQILNKINILKTIKKNIENTIMKCNSENEKNFKINKIDLEEYFSNESLETEVREFKNEGLYYLYDVEFEIDWFGVIFLGLAGIAQIGIGILCLMNGYIRLGTFLVGGGIEDIIDLLIILKGDNNLNIEDYISKKAISILAALFSMGLKTLSSMLGIPVAKTPGPSSGSESLSSLLMEIGLTIGIKTTIQKLLDTSADIVINQFREKVKESILKELKVSLDDPTILIYLNKLLAKDALCEEGEFNGMAMDTLIILENKKDIFRKLIDSGLEEILKSKFPILKEISIIAKTADMAKTLNGINKVAKETAKEISKVFKSKIERPFKQKMELETILEKKLKPKINLEDAKEIIKLLKEYEIIKEEEFDEVKAQEIGNRAKEDLIKLYEERATNFILAKIKTRALGCLTNVISDKLSEHINDKVKAGWEKLKNKRDQKLKNIQNIIFKEEINYSQKEETAETSKLDITKIITDNFKRTK